MIGFQAEYITGMGFGPATQHGLYQNSEVIKKTNNNNIVHNTTEHKLYTQ